MPKDTDSKAERRNPTIMVENTIRQPGSDARHKENPGARLDGQDWTPQNDGLSGLSSVFTQVQEADDVTTNLGDSEVVDRMKEIARNFPCIAREIGPKEIIRRYAYREGDGTMLICTWENHTQQYGGYFWHLTVARQGYLPENKMNYWKEMFGFSASCQVRHVQAGEYSTFHLMEGPFNE